MKKTLVTCMTIIGILTLSACSNRKESSKNNNTSNTSVSSNSKSQESSSSVTQSNSQNQVISNSTTQANSKSNTEQVKATPSIFSGYSDDQIEYARVVEALIHYYNGSYQPKTISATVNGINHPVFPFKGSVVIPQDTVTLSFSADNTMAGTTIVTYRSNHNGSISFYKDPNHYQDDRYLNNPSWVNEESQKLLDSMQTLEIPTAYDNQALQFISQIQVK